MKSVAFFDLEPWEKDFFRRHLRGYRLKFFDGSLSEKHLSQLKKVDALVVFIYSSITQKILSKLTKVRFIATLSTGFDHIDITACKRMGIIVSNVPEYGSNTVAEHTFALILSLSRKIPESVERTKKGDFSLEGLRGWDLAGKTLGIIGLGKIGVHVARIAQGFEMNVLAYDPYSQGIPGAKMVSLKSLLQQSDVISLHCPLNEQTRDLLNKNTFKWIKKGAVLINTARGGLVQTEALLKALKEKRISAAAMDVLEEECSIREEKELLHEAFQKTCDLKTVLQQHALIAQDNVLVTPHNAFNSNEALERILQTTLGNIKGFFEGKTQNTVLWRNEKWK